ncbi:hypothetical protein ACF09C_04420 [Streptomyces sp. NPDC014870]|uniref:hypothetical protein n=1 Tax=Streptomyces sp. NPDC014870 TaxID=3364925 RepID=UPI003701F644
MTVQPNEARAEVEPLSRLFDPGQRIGWVYRDAEAFRHAFTQPPPAPVDVPETLLNRARAARLNTADRKGTALKVGGGLTAFFLLVSLFAGGIGLLLAAVSAAGAVVLYTQSGGAATTADQKVEQVRHELAQRYQHESAAWTHAKSQFEYTEDQRIRGLDVWGALPVGTGNARLDVFGGTRRSREGFLTVFGASTLRERPLIVLDLTQSQICRELSILSAEMGAPVDVQLLPSQQPQSSILDGLQPAELVDALVEAVYGDTSEATRAGRSMDSRILNRLCEALGDDVTPARIAAGLRALLGDLDDSGTLTRAERNRISDDLLPDKSKDQIREGLMRLESFVQPLAGLGTERAGRGPGYLTCFSLDRTTGSASVELLTDLAILSVARRLSTLVEEQAPAVVVALGEHEVQRRHLEQLARVCEWRGAQLTVMHAHLRETARDMIGGGAVAFMRLGNHQEAGVAADFLGRDYKFILHSLTDTQGESVSDSVTHTTGTSTSTATSVGFSRSWGENWGTSSSSTYSDGFGFPTSTTSGSSSGGNYSESENRSVTKTFGTNESTAHTKGTTVSTSDGTTTQRVYEYVLEPTQLQGLAEFSLVFVERGPDGAVRTHAAVCNPNIVKLERFSNQPLVELPLPQQVAVPPQRPAAAPAQPAQAPPPQAPTHPVYEPQPAPGGQPHGGAYGVYGAQPTGQPQQPAWPWPQGGAPQQAPGSWPPQAPPAQPHQQQWPGQGWPPQQ